MRDKQCHMPRFTRFSRRNFLCTAASAAAVAAAAAPTHRRVNAAAKSPNDRLGIGVIGVGSRGNGHLRELQWLRDNTKEVDIVAVCDVYRPRLQHAAETYGAKTYMDYRDLLADPNVDIVSIATPDHHHAYQAIDAVRAGKDVYCEKPVTHWRQFELTKRLASELRNSDRVFQLGTQGMSDSAWHQMKKLVQDGIIGQPILAECGYFRVGDWGERGMPIDDPNARPGPDLNWKAFLGDAPRRSFDVSRFFRWRMYEDYAGGPVTDLYPHSLTPVINILGVTLPSAVAATGGKFRYEEREVPDTFNLLIDYPQKITVAVLGTQGNNYFGTGERGSAGRVPVIRGWDGTLTIEKDEIIFIPAEGSSKQPQRFPIERRENLLDHWKNLLECCRSRKKDTFSPADLAYYTQTALIMGMLSFRKGKTARFDAEKERIVL